MEDYIVLTDGSIIEFKDVLKRVPISMLESELHSKVCDALAKSKSDFLNEDELKVYANLLYLKSKRAKQITGAVFLINNGKLSVARIHSDLINESICKLIEKPFIFEKQEAKSSNIIKKKHFLVFFFKTVVHNIFRQLARFKKKLPPSESIVRTWADLSEDVYGNEMKTSSIVIYPFNPSFLRQFRFIKKLNKKYKNWSFSGVPYRFYDVLNLIFNFSKRDIIIAKAEAAAFYRHAEEVRTTGIKKIYTTDEFEVASFVMYKRLSTWDIMAYNSAHGIGMYCPHIFYTGFKLMNKSQKAHYVSRNADVNYTFGSRFKPGIDKHDFKSDDAGFNPMIVFIHQNTLSLGMHYEGQFEDDAIFQVKLTSNELGVPFMLKLHPNTSYKDEMAIQKKYGVKTVRLMSEISEGNPIFVNMYSTSYYTFLNKGPFIFLEDDIFTPRFFFGDDISVTTTSKVGEKIRMIITRDEWLKQLDKQIESERELFGWMH